MKFGIVIKLFNILLAISLLLAVTTVVASHKANAQPEPIQQTPEQCIGEALANYMNAITAAKGSGPGQIPSNVKLLSPAFNMTSHTFSGIADGMKQGGADFSKLDGIAGNVYNVGGQNISHYLETVRATFPGAHFVITETGTFDHSDRGIIDLAKELEKLRNSGDIDAALLFNGSGTNSGWSQHAFTPEQIRTLCGGDCTGKKLGINTANMFGYTPESYYQQAGSGSLRMSHSLEIADAGQINNTIKGIQNSINNGITPIIRIGVGSSSGGFDNPATYAAFLSEIGNRFRGVDIYAIAGPNEPDLEPWLTPECALLPIVPIGDMCVGPVNVDLSTYRGQVIGHQDPSPDGEGPWKIYASATDNKENSSDLVSSVIVDRMRITPSKFWHTDFSTMTQKYIGSLDTVNDDFINTKVESQFKMDTLESRSPPIYLTSHIPGYVHTSGFEIPAQKEIQPGEEYKTFQSKVYPSQDGKKPGQKSTIDGFSNTAFIGCLQAAVCDPRIEKCLKNDKSGNYCNRDDDPAGCTGVGKLLKFQMKDEEINLLEPQDLQAMDKVLWDFGAAVVRKPGDSVPRGRGTILATSLEDYYAQEQQLLAEVEAKKQELTGNVIPTNLTASSSSQNSNISSTLQNANPITPKQAQAQTPPFGTDQSAFCSGANILIENKTGENQFGVKVWNGQPNCPQVVDWAYYVEYWVGNDTDGYEQVGTCGDPNGSNIHKSAGLPAWKPDTDPNASPEEKWGISVGDLQGCSIPVTPRELEETGKQLKVHFQISGGRVPNPETSGSDPSCTQYPVCSCPNEAACGIKSNQPLPPIDCTKCETWAPSGECATMVAEDLLEETQCAEGYCEINNGEFRLADSLDDPPEEEKKVTLEQIITNIFAGIFQGGAKLFNYHCDKEDDWTDVNEVKHDGDWECTFGERQYLMYGYVPGRFKGKLNQYRTTKDFQIYQAIYKVPGVSESYFDPMSSKHELELTLELNPEDGDTIQGNHTPECGGDTLASRLLRFGFGGPASCLDLAISGGKSRSMYIEYTDHFSQAAQYCLSEATGSLPNNFPTRALDLCQPFMSQLRGGAFLSGAPGGTSLTSGTLKDIENQSLQLGVPARLLATILEIEGGSSNSCYRSPNPGDTGTGPYQITDDLYKEITTPAERTQWKLQDWPAGTSQSIYREDGRCDFTIANQLAARALKLKAGLDYKTGTISETQFTVIRDALNGYYGEYNGYCGPTSDTEGRWGQDISYCDYGLYRMGLTQYCTNGQLSPACDNVNSETVSETTETKQVFNEIFRPATETGSPDETSAQKQLLADIESLLTKYSKNTSFDMDSPIEQMPIGFQKELENIERTYREKYSL